MRLARRHLRGERAELVLDCHDLVRTFVGRPDRLVMLIGNVVLDVKNLRLLPLACIGASNVSVASCQPRASQVPV